MLPSLNLPIFVVQSAPRATFCWPYRTIGGITSRFIWRLAGDWLARLPWGSTISRLGHERKVGLAVVTIVVGEPRHFPGAPLWLVLASNARDPLV